VTASPALIRAPSRLPSLPPVRAVLVGVLLVGAHLAPASPVSHATPAAAQAPVPPPPGDSLALKVHLERLEEVFAAGGWGSVPPGPTLRPGEADPRVVQLRTRLRRSGDLPDPAPGEPGSGATSPVFDDTLEATVRRFQARHALDVDGVVGPATLAALNVPVDHRIRQVALNLEHRRAHGEDPGPWRILVNIPGFEAYVTEEGAPHRRHRVIVGRVDRPTPIVSGSIEHVVLAPTWNVPPGILANDKLPELRRDPTYLARNRMSILDRATERAVDPSTLDFHAISASEFNARYWIRQAPGPTNALGLVKFIFPNPHVVFLHDTPDRHLFERGRRAFSSGCIRLDGAMELAERLVATVRNWDAERARTVSTGGVETWVRLPAPVPIRTVYWTAWVDADGTLHLADDLYGLDDLPPSASRGMIVHAHGGPECVAP
jgi:L,D-transpeptidase YcbB